MTWKAYHALDNVLNLAHGKFQDQADSLLILTVFLDYLLKELFCLRTVFLFFDSGIAGDTRILFHRPKADDLIAVIH